MLSDLVAKLRCAVVHIVLVDDTKRRVGSGSGFLVGDFLITSNHVINVPDNVHYFIKKENDNASEMDKKLYKHNDFISFLAIGSDKDNYDYAILKVPNLASGTKNTFEFGSSQDARVGNQIAFLGFPLEHENLVCHEGIISSIYRSGPARMFQIDASVNQSNSGGPLVDVSSGKVIGIVTRKATGLTKQFEQLTTIYDENIRALEQSAANGMLSLGGFDPVKAFISGQQQMKALAQEILRSANVGIGYAISSEHVAAEQVFQRRN